jgi:hypothetical protein
VQQMAAIRKYQSPGYDVTRYAAVLGGAGGQA